MHGATMMCFVIIIRTRKLLKSLHPKFLKFWSLFQWNQVVNPTLTVWRMILCSYIQTIAQKDFNINYLLFCLYKLSYYCLLVPTNAHIILIYIYYYYYHHHHHHHPLYARYLYLYSIDKLCPYGIQCCSCSVVTIHGAYIVSFSVESVVILH